MLEVTIYYGMSGAFKSTTINSIIDENILSMKSDIKYWKSIENGPLKLSLLNTNKLNLNYAIHHLCKIQDYLQIAQTFSKKRLILERGVSDMLFYAKKNKEVLLTDIIGTVKHESNILQDCKVNKILLQQLDKDFVNNVILKEPTRKDHFKNWKEFKKAQDDYVLFTKKFNQIDEIIDITDAKTYLESINVSFI